MTPTAVTVGLSSNITNLNAELHLGGKISGTVTSAQGGAPIGEAEICALTIEGEEFLRCSEQ